MECHESIRAAEKTQEEEIKWRQEKEQQIQNMHGHEWKEIQAEVFTKILDKSVYMKARDKMTDKKEKVENTAADKGDKDYLLPILKKLNLQYNDKNIVFDNH